MAVYSSEWLVVDRRGAFAMGSLDGARTRKYHGFFMGIPGRSEMAYLVDLEFECNGVSLWTHCYKGPEGPLLYPDPDLTGIQSRINELESHPEWEWTTDRGSLTFSVASGNPAGISLNWKWVSKTQDIAHLKVRGLWAMRDLHSLGGKTWTWNEGDTYLGRSKVFPKVNKSIPSTSDLSTQVRILSSEGREVHCLLRGQWTWTDDPQWYRDFHYTEEVERGYPANEDLFSAGVLETHLKTEHSAHWILSEDVNDLKQTGSFNSQTNKSQGNKSQPKNSQTKNSQDDKSQPKSKVSDFVLSRPAGIVAGFPWFGEWGRDTFISLPGIVMELVESGQDPNQVWNWTRELLNRWGQWIERSKMIPNVLEKNGLCQWEAADATLWWCHSLAAIWSYSLSTPLFGSKSEEIRAEFSHLLDRVIDSIRNGEHQFLKYKENDLVEVTTAHTTWMDVRLEGRSVTPRLGCLPEINALWFEARCLQLLWQKTKSATDLTNLRILGEQVLQCREPDRPNPIFLHSLSLSPSFVLKKYDCLENDLIEVAEKFWSPVGLKSLSASHPSFHPHCVGGQKQRDLAYHQGTVWGWLGGHFEMARDRLEDHLGRPHHDKMFTKGLMDDMPIQGHIAEIFDAEPPYTPRGAPAQAWSLACVEEAKWRRRLKIDSKMNQILGVLF